MRNFFQAFLWLVLEQAGINPKRILRTLSGLPRYLFDLRLFKQRYHGEIKYMPCLHDWSDVAGAVTSEYFGQDLYVAQRIFRASPNNHVDIGSRIDGFVAQVAAFRNIEVIDIRPVNTEIPNVTFKQADFTCISTDLEAYCDSLSCLHALEHFGLGRYGDPVDPNGFTKGLSNLARMINPGGVLYLSVPVGKASVMFNAHRVSDPLLLTSMALELGLSIEVFAYWNRDRIVEAIDIENEMRRIASLDYSLGIFVFRRIK